MARCGAALPAASESSARVVVALCCILVVTVLAVDRPTQPSSPIIAHVTMPLVNCLHYATPEPSIDASGGCVNALYVKWLWAAGVRTVPVSWNGEWAAVKAVLDRANGVLLPGGDLSGLDWTLYRQNITPIVDYAMRRNQDGDPFLLWGTCQGFQVMATIFAEDPSILRCHYKGVEGVELPLNMTDHALGSIMFPTSTQDDAFRMFATKPVTLNLHQCGVDPADWNTVDVLRSQFRVVATNTDAAGRVFVSAYESSRTTLGGAANILAVQFHPERSPYEFDYAAIGHSDDDMKGSWYMAMLVRRRLQLAALHTYPSPEDADKALIDRYPMTSIGWGKGYYWIGRTTSTTPGGATKTGGRTSVEQDSKTPSTSWAVLVLIALFFLTMGIVARRSAQHVMGLVKARPVPEAAILTSGPDLLEAGDAAGPTATDDDALNAAKYDVKLSHRSATSKLPIVVDYDFTPPHCASVKSPVHHHQDASWSSASHGQSTPSHHHNSTTSHHHDTCVLSRQEV